MNKLSERLQQLYDSKANERKELKDEILKAEARVENTEDKKAKKNAEKYLADLNKDLEDKQKELTKLSDEMVLAETLENQIIRFEEQEAKNIEAGDNELADKAKGQKENSISNYEKLVEDCESKYDFVLNEEEKPVVEELTEEELAAIAENSQGEESLEAKKTSKNSKAVRNGIIAVAAVAAIVFGGIKLGGNIRDARTKAKKDSNNTVTNQMNDLTNRVNETPVTTQPTATPTATPTPEVEEGFVNLENEEKLNEQIQLIRQEDMEKYPEIADEMNDEDVEKVIRWFAGATDNENDFNDAYARFMYVNNKGAYDWSRYCFDNSKNQKFFAQYADLMTEVYATKGIEGEAEKTMDNVAEFYYKTTQNNEGKEGDRFEKVQSLNNLDSKAARFAALMAINTAYAKCDGINWGEYPDKYGVSHFAGGREGMVYALEQTECFDIYNEDQGRKSVNMIDFFYYDAIDEVYANAGLVIDQEHTRVLVR